MEKCHPEVAPTVQCHPIQNCLHPILLLVKHGPLVGQLPRLRVAVEGHHLVRLGVDVVEGLPVLSPVQAVGEAQRGVGDGERAVLAQGVQGGLVAGDLTAWLFLGSIEKQLFVFVKSLKFCTPVGRGIRD